MNKQSNIAWRIEMKVIEQRNCMGMQVVKRENVSKVFIAQAGDTIEIELDNVKQLIKVLQEFVDEESN